MTGRDVNATIEHMRGHLERGELVCACDLSAGLTAAAALADSLGSALKRPTSWRCASSRGAFASLRLVLDPPMPGGPLLTAHGPEGYQVGIQLDPAAHTALLELGARCKSALDELVANHPDRRGAFDRYHPQAVVDLVGPAKGTVRAAAGGFVSAHVRTLRRRGERQAQWVCEVFVSARNGTYSVFFRPTEWSEFLHELGRGLDVAA